MYKADITKPEKVLPPPKFLKAAEHHWIQDIDSDGRLMDLVVLQWNPGAQRWSYSGYVGTGIYISPGPNARWVAHCPMPALE